MNCNSQAEEQRLRHRDPYSIGSDKAFRSCRWIRAVRPSESVESVSTLLPLPFLAAVCGSPPAILEANGESGRDRYVVPGLRLPGPGQRLEAGNVVASLDADAELAKPELTA